MSKDEVMLAAAQAGHPTPGLNLRPKTRPTLAAKLRVGQVLLESEEHPVKIVSVGYQTSLVVIHCRYIWQSKAEPTWILGKFHPTALLEKAV